VIELLEGDCREVMPARGPFDMILADPPYGDTSIRWDKRVRGWLDLAYAALKPAGSMWVFGSMRFFMLTQGDFRRAGWRYAQDVVWEKHNGSNARADRFRRVHEHAVQFYRKTDDWGGVYNSVQTTPDATPRTIRRKGGVQHWGAIGGYRYVSEDGGPRIVRSVIVMPSMHGRAIHPTEKPVGLLEILVRTSCPPDGLVGDWFAGSGAAGEACALSGRRYVGCELDGDMAERARARLGSSLWGAQPANSRRIQKEITQ
jgi:site-specific DNA-methyltransferase (adenine-specific)